MSFEASQASFPSVSASYLLEELVFFSANVLFISLNRVILFYCATVFNCCVNGQNLNNKIILKESERSSVADSDPNTDPDPSDLYVFGPPGSYHLAKIVRKTLIPTAL